MSEEIALSQTESILWPKYHPGIPYPGDEFMETQGWLDNHLIIPNIQYDEGLNAYSADGEKWIPVMGSEVEAVADEGESELKPWEIDPDAYESVEIPGYGVLMRKKKVVAAPVADLKTVMDQLVALVLPDYYLTER